MKLFHSLVIGAAAAAATAPPFVLLRPVCAQKPAAAQSGVRVTVREAGLSLTIPPGYKQVPKSSLPPQLQQAVFYCTGPVTKQFASNVNLVMQPAPPGIKVDVSVADALEPTLKKVLPLYKKVKTGTLTVNGSPAAFIIGNFTTQGHIIQNKQVIFVRGSQAYTFTFTADASVFAKQVGAFDKMVAGVKGL